jgi:hypothetical protein
VSEFEFPHFHERFEIKFQTVNVNSINSLGNKEAISPGGKNVFVALYKKNKVLSPAMEQFLMLLKETS